MSSQTAYKIRVKPKITCQNQINLLKCCYCAKWGVSGALYLQSAIAGPNVFRDETNGRLRFIRSVEGKVLCNRQLRTVSG